MSNSLILDSSNTIFSRSNYPGGCWVPSHPTGRRHGPAPPLLPPAGEPPRRGVLLGGPRPTGSTRDCRGAASTPPVAGFPGSAGQPLHGRFGQPSVEASSVACHLGLGCPPLRLSADTPRSSGSSRCWSNVFYVKTSCQPKIWNSRTL